MKGKYTFVYNETLDSYNSLAENLDRQFGKIATAIYDSANTPFVNIYLDNGLLVGEYEPSIEGYPAIQFIKLVGSSVYLKLDSLDEPELIQSLQTLGIIDKMAILEFLENHFKEL